MSTSRRTTAVAALKPGDVDADDSFVEVEIDVADPGPHDLLIEVRAVSVNPVDVKVRASFEPGDEPKVLGFDAAGVVVAVGDEVSAFEVGDDVYYAGSIARSGSNAGLQLVDEHIVGHKPTTLDYAEAAALPLTAITAWETLFDRLFLTSESSGTLLVLAGAGGVGSMITQLARARTEVTVVATGARPESVQFATDMGAHHVVDHHDLVASVGEVAPQGVDWVFSPFSAGNVEAFAELLTVHGEVVAIDDPEQLDLSPLKNKSQTWHWEFMFTRPLYTPQDPYQRDVLDEVARMVDAGQVRTTMTTRLSPIDADTLREAHRRVETSTTVGKIVVSRD